MNEQDQLHALNEMRDLMKRSSRFLSLSGISGVCAGVFALIGAAAVVVKWQSGLVDILGPDRAEFGDTRGFLLFFALDAGTVLVLSLVSAWFFSWRKAKKEGVLFWDLNAKRMLINLMIPLAAGGIFCLALLFQGNIGLIAPATLVFYGLALLNASKYTVNDIRYLGIIEIALGIIASFMVGWGLFFWALGFGVMHIIYGAVLYYKYER